MGSDWKLGPAVEGGRIRFLSVSAIDKFDDRFEAGCKLRWWLRYCAKKKEPQTASQDKGEEFHTQIENFLKTGVDGFAPAVRAGKDFLTQLRPYVIGVEYHLEKVTPDETEILPDSFAIAGVPLVGKIDAAAYMNGLQLWDWKSTSNIDKYGKQPPELIKNTQLIGYAKYARTCGIGAKVYELPYLVGHGYFQTKGTYRFVPRTATFTRPMLGQAFAPIEQVVENMKSVAGEKTPDNIPSHGTACHAYGGCPHLSYCPKYNSKENAKMGFAAMLKNAAAAKSAQITPPDAPTKAPEPAPTAPQTTNLTPGGHERKMVVKDVPEMTTQEKAGIIPPPKAVREAEAANEDTEKRGPGRPKGAKNKPKEDAAVTSSEVDVSSGPKIVTVHYSNGVTLATGPKTFEFVRFDYGATAACLDSDKDKAYELVKAEVDKRIDKDTDEFLKQREESQVIKAV